ncbi:hypothetical protein BC938DRAFT_477290 [Jimgerdemannia flammicorona]|uniref:Methyltransferase small domain-containing protein n=1 Tax=Jimgerdemannia flammicorona TaxID=994334 RepID=A0A433PAP5_9FUNG|nr:hypothetical protein BC938DRAFT_477290 [Jimgerdemannia flammicorona]
MFTLHQIRINEPFNRDEMKLKELESQLQDCAAFENPKIKLEQYPTTAHLAARMLFTADSVYNDIQDKSIGDFGCGCGILRIKMYLRFPRMIQKIQHRRQSNVPSLCHVILRIKENAAGIHYDN